MNKILEAIQRGIQMGLEIQDDELDQSVFQGSEITSTYHVDRADQLRWRRENFVDLGLPSGTLWCKWNIGATNGNTAESWYGNCYAWGEIETKEDFAWETYKHCNGSHESLTKYTDADGKVTLEPEDDIVNVTLGKKFRMPTAEDFKELCSLQNEWVKNYNGVNGLNGMMFTGHNRNKLFIPAAGYRYGSYFYGAGSYCHLWSSSLNFTYPGSAYNLYFSSGYIDPFINSSRYNGLSVRAVI